jgi:hypothetical protein
VTTLIALTQNLPGGTEKIREALVTIAGLQMDVLTRKNASAGLLQSNAVWISRALLFDIKHVTARTLLPIGEQKLSPYRTFRSMKDNHMNKIRAHKIKKQKN